MKKDNSGLSIIPLGGVGEIGKNMVVFEYGEDIIVVDAGVAFPGEELYGIDLVIQDIRYLVRNKDRVRGIFITHGHEDHIGALPYVLKDIDVPVYATRLTIGLIKKRLTEHAMEKTAKLIEIHPDDVIRAGVFTVEFFRINHSIPDGVGLAIDTPEGLVVHSGDFKLDHTPIDGRVTELHKLASYGARGVLLFMCDSTGAENEGFTPSEKVVGETFAKEFERAEGRIIVATFASNVHRIQQVVNAAVEHDRKIAVVGRSMVNVVEAARELDYLSCPDSIMIDIDQINKYAPHRIVIITTGSQGEPMAALTRIAEGSHRQIVLEPGDTVILSATPIPGNAKHVYRTINNLFKGGARVVYRDIASVHVSGHAAKEEIKTLINIVKPQYAMPFHGEYRHLIKFRKTASELGIPEKNVIISSIGDKNVFHLGRFSMQGKVHSGSIMIDGLGVGDVGNIVLRDRRHLAEDGVVVAVLSIDKTTGALLSGPDIVSRGFVYVRESEALLARMKHELDRTVKTCEKSNIREWSKIKEQIRKTLSNVMYSETKRKPLILPIIMEV
ncbi:ribonuclease J [Phosphitispora fastidiosa]|uniref:ribonuclease J n=1 Tax=Phosphitispora fastidiosa TaxID=2837202 RepID=UPI001E3AC6C5|nr:ribonuclease J [Phosphitispora fastidiosa]MBU7008054.1 ribonuclease J [Phosphitispora fastidiosa]